MTTKHMIFHVPFKLGYAISGGGIRPQKLMRGFENLGYAVDVISGPKAQRVRAMRAIRQAMAQGRAYDFLYAETSVLPTMMTEKNNRPFYPFVDFDFFRFLKARGVPRGIFYRDMYWKYRKDRSKEVPFVKRQLMRLFYNWELRMYARVMDTLFLPTDVMREMVSDTLAAKAMACPPGHDVEGVVERPTPRSLQDLSLIYVGGVSSPYYDITALLRLAARVPVTVSCRKEEAPKWSGFYGDLWNNARVIHVSGPELVEEYRRHAVCAIVKKPHEYLNKTIPLKLYEAIGQNIPILTNAGTIIADRVQDMGIGWVFNTELTDVDFDQVIEEYPAKVERLVAVKGEHTWDTRAAMIRDRLLGQRNPVQESAA